jgi:hypothetical protein
VKKKLAMRSKSFCYVTVHVAVSLRGEVPARKKKIAKGAGATLNP